MADIELVSTAILDQRVGKELVGRYLVGEEIGSGGMGTVYRGRQLAFDSDVAIKFIRASITEPTQVQRFKREAQVLSALSHPNIVKILAVDVLDGECFLVMEFIDGQTLDQYIARRGPLSTEEFRQIFIQVVDAISHVHESGIVHRDLKPSNIIITNDGRVKVVDFGMAKLVENDQRVTATGAIVGSPVFMSPEQCCGTQVDARSDIYSLGCVMYHALTGHPPFSADSPWEIICHHMSDPVPRIDNPALEMLAGVIYKATEKDALNRYQNMADLKEAILHGEFYQPVTTTSGAKKAQARLKKRYVVAFLVAMGVCAYAALISVPAFIGKSKGSELESLPLGQVQDRLTRELMWVPNRQDLECVYRKAKESNSEYAFWIAAACAQRAQETQTCEYWFDRYIHKLGNPEKSLRFRTQDRLECIPRIYDDHAQYACALPLWKKVVGVYPHGDQRLYLAADLARLNRYSEAIALLEPWLSAGCNGYPRTQHEAASLLAHCKQKKLH